MTSPSSGSVSVPRATYRVQLHAGFTFDDAAAIVPQLADLGVSHLYCSPMLQAAPGSTHGYDVVDHSRLSDELGGRSGYDDLCRVLAEHDMALVLDIVPNHMALAGARNRWWWDVLEDGPASRYASHFDIDWSPTGHGPGPSVLAPILGDHYGRILEAGGLVLARSAGSCTVTYEDHELPLSPESVSVVLAAAARRPGAEELLAVATAMAALPGIDELELADPAALQARHEAKEALRGDLRALTAGDPEIADAVDAELAAISDDPDALDAILALQRYRLAHWRTASEEIDYRRFFDITTLVGLRAEDPRVFDDTHALILELVAARDVVGLRVDHIDGLRDPAGYLERLAEAAPSAFVVVEKILGPDEALPAWPVAGTSGYDFLNRVNDVYVDRTHCATITDVYNRFVDDEAAFDEVSSRAKRDVMAEELAAEVERLTELLARVCAQHRRHRDHTRRDLREVVSELAGSFDVYRTYVRPGREPSEQDRATVDAAVSKVVTQGSVDPELATFLGKVLLLEVSGDEASELALRFQQLSAPVMAKGLEDTAFYRYNRLVALNEVGGAPGSYGSELDALHRHNAEMASRWPATMLTLSTHDTKRSCDVRARITLLSELPEAWPQALTKWAAHNKQHRDDGFNAPSLELLLYETLVGAWPISADRVVAAMTKSAREAKEQTSWAQQDEHFEQQLERFVEAVLSDDEFCSSLELFCRDNQIVEQGRRSSLAQLALLLTSPGFPDIYQGSELWDLSLVDPDNRRPVDFEHRRALAAQVADSNGQPPVIDDSGVAKYWLISTLLQHRRLNAELYSAGDYHPIAVEGAKSRHVIAFARGPLIVVVPRLLIGLDGDWGDTSVTLPDGQWRDVLTGEQFDGGPLDVATLLRGFVVSVLEQTVS